MGEWCHQVGPGWGACEQGPNGLNPLVLTFGVMVLEKGAISTTLVQYLTGCGKLNDGLKDICPDSRDLWMSPYMAKGSLQV